MIFQFILPESLLSLSPTAQLSNAGEVARPPVRALPGLSMNLSTYHARIVDTSSALQAVRRRLAHITQRALAAGELGRESQAEDAKDCALRERD
jgi:hypothetical protein